MLVLGVGGFAEAFCGAAEGSVLRMKLAKQVQQEMQQMIQKAMHMVQADNTHRMNPTGTHTRAEQVSMQAKAANSTNSKIGEVAMLFIVAFSSGYWALENAGCTGG